MAVLLTGMKSVMQKEIFEPNDERLLAVISVTKSTGRKKKPSFLAISGILICMCTCKRNFVLG